MKQNPCNSDCHLRVKDGKIFCECHNAVPTNRIFNEGQRSGCDPACTHIRMTMHHIVYTAYFCDEKDFILLDSEM